MPRKTINLSHKVEYLSVLDEKGKLDKKIEPEISDELLLKLHKAMLLGRRFDERLLSLQRQGRIGTFAPISGQEASQLGPWLSCSPRIGLFLPLGRQRPSCGGGGPMEKHSWLWWLQRSRPKNDETSQRPCSRAGGLPDLHAVGIG